MKKRLLSMLLALSMLIGMVPTSVLAAETGPIVATADGKPVEVSVVEDATDQYGGPVYYVAYPMGSDLVVSLNDGISNAVVMQDSGYYWSSYNDADPGAEKATLPYDILLEIGLPFDSFGTDCGHYANIGTGNLGLQLEVLGIVVYEDGGMEARAAYTLVVEAVHECYDDDDDGCCDDCGEELVAAEPTYKITDKSGYLYADVSNAKVGETVTITVKAPDGEVLTSLSVTTNGENVAYEKTEDGTYTFTMPAADVELDGTFAAAVPVRAMILDDDEIGEATVTLNGVVVTPDDSVMAAPGETVYVTVEPTKGWVVNGAKGTYYAMSGGSISPQNIVVGDNLDGTFAVTIPEDAINMFGMGFDINIDLVPAPAEYAVNIAETTGGTVSVGKMVNSELVSIETAPANQTVVVTATPNEGYELDAITVTAADGESVRVTGTTFAMPGKDVTVTVTFKRSFTGYTITVVESENGKVEASKTSAEADEDIFLTVTPDAGYKLDTLSVTYVEEGYSESYTVDVYDNAFIMPNGNVTITATFVSNVVVPDKDVNLDISEVTVKTSVIEPGVSRVSVPVKVQYHVGTNYTSNPQRLDFTVKYDTDLLTFAGMVPTSTVPYAHNTSTSYTNAKDNGNGTVSVSYSYKSAIQRGSGYDSGDSWLDLCDLQFTVNEGKLPTSGKLSAELTVEGAVVFRRTSNATALNGDSYTVQEGSLTLEYSNEKAYSVNIGTYENGTVTGPGRKVIPGEIVTLTATAASSSYALASMSVEGVELTKTSASGNNTTFTFVMPEKDVTVNASFVAAKKATAGRFTLSNGQNAGSYCASTTLNGAALNNMGIALPVGGEIEVICTPQTGYIVPRIYYTNAAGETIYIELTDGKGSFVMPDENITLIPEVEMNPATMTVEFGDVTVKNTDLTEGNMNVVVPVYVTFENCEVMVGTNNFEPSFDAEKMSFAVSTGYSRGNDLSENEKLSHVSSNSNKINYKFDPAQVPPTGRRHVANLTFTLKSAEPGSYEVNPISVAAQDTTGKSLLSCTYNLIPGTITVKIDCDHVGTETTPDYKQVEGKKEHTVTEKCECGQQIGEATTEPCMDADLNEKCDKCGGAVELTKYDLTLINATAKVNGNAVTAAAEGQTVVLAIIPSEGQMLDRLFVMTAVGESSIDYTRNEDGTYSFTMPGEAVSVIARCYDAIPLEITNSEKGEITAFVNGASVTAVCEGQTVTLQVNVAEGNELSKVIVKYDEDDYYKDYEIPVTKNDDGTWTFEVPGGTVQVIRISAAYTCAHTETTTTHVQVSSKEEHTITVTCACGEKISENTEVCADTDKDGKCDKCEGTVTAKYTLSVGSVNWSYAKVTVNNVAPDGWMSNTKGKTAQVAAGATVKVTKGNEATGVTFDGFATVVNGVRTTYKSGETFTMPEADVVLEFDCSTTGTASVTMGANQTGLNAATSTITIPMSLSYTLGTKTAGVYVEMEYDPAVLDYTSMSGFTSVTETEDGKLLVWYSKSVSSGAAGSASGSLTFAPVAGADGKSAAVNATAFRPYQGQMQGILHMNGETLDEVNISFVGSCDHVGTETITDYVQVEGKKEHTVTVKCECGQQIGEVTTEPCVDADLNEKCDKCKGAVELTKYELTLINATAKVNGNAVTSAAEGQTVVLTITPSEGQMLDRLFVMTADDDSAIDYTRNEDGTYSFTMPGEAVSVIARCYDAIPLEITNSEKGEITAFVNGASVTAVCEGQTVTLQVKVAAGNYLSNVIVQYDEDGYPNMPVDVTKNDDGTWTFDVPTMAMVIRISADYTCAHATVNTTYEQVAGSETHKVIKTCAACSAPVGEVTTAPCEDLFKDGTCDICGGSVTVPEDKVSVWDGITYSSSLQTATYNNEKVYVINSAADLVFWAKQNIAATTSNSSYRIQSVVLNNDIDLGGHAWTSLKEFDAVFYGMGHTISGLNVSGRGFITRMDNGNTFRNGEVAIRDLTLEGSVSSSDEHTGAFVGQCYGEVINCISYVNVSGTNHVGGIVGSGDATTAIRNCANYGNVTGSSHHVAGILGHGAGAYVQNCYNRGNVQGEDTVAGIANGSYDDTMTIRNCYNTGNVKASSNQFGNAYHGPIAGRSAYEVINCYFLNNATYSGDGESYMAGTALSPAELKAAASKLGSDWVEDTYNLNDGYPIQKWQEPDVSKIVALTAPTLIKAAAGQVNNGIVDNTVIVTAPDASEQIFNAPIQYRVSSDNQNWSEWQSGEEFYGLTPGATYYFQARYVSTKLHKYTDSEPSNAISATVAAIPEDAEIVQLSAPVLNAALVDVKESSIEVSYPMSTGEDDYMWDEFGLAYYRVGVVSEDGVTTWGEWSEDGVAIDGTYTFNDLEKGTGYGIQARFVSRGYAVPSAISETMYVTTADGMMNVSFRLIGITKPNTVGGSGENHYGGIDLGKQLEAAMNYKVVDGYDGAVYRNLLKTESYQVPGGITATNFVGYPLSDNDLSYELKAHYFTKVEVPAIFAADATDDSGAMWTNGYYYGASAGWYIFVIRGGEVISEGEPDEATTVLQDGDSVVMCFVADSSYEMRTHPMMGSDWPSLAVSSGMTDLVYHFLNTPDIDHEEYKAVLALEKQIDALVVNKDSDAEIKAAEEAYALLSADQQKAMKNYKKLVDARAKYDELQLKLGDLNGDKAVDQKDVTLLIQFLAECDVTIAEQYADLNKDGNIDLLDLIILRRHLASGSGSWEDYVTLPYVPAQ